MTLEELKCIASISENLAIINHNFKLLEEAANNAAVASEFAQGAFSGYYSDLTGTPILTEYLTAEQARSMIDDAVAAIYTFKGTAANTEALPAEAAIGDVYYLTDPGKSVAWNGTQWADITMPLSLDGYLKDEDVTAISAAQIATLFEETTGEPATEPDAGEDPETEPESGSETPENNG